MNKNTKNKTKYLHTHIAVSDEPFGKFEGKMILPEKVLCHTTKGDIFLEAFNIEGFSIESNCHEKLIENLVKETALVLCHHENPTSVGSSEFYTKMKDLCGKFNVKYENKL